MDKQQRPLNIYLMGIAGAGMGSFAGLLQRCGHRVSGSDSAVYSPMREKLIEWGINFTTPYRASNLPASCDLVIVGNVIRRDNPEAMALIERDIAYDSFPSALKKLFLERATSIVASGTHGKTTCSSILARSLYSAGHDPGFLIGGVPSNFTEGFRAPGQGDRPFVVEGDEYDTAFFDKRPKFIHYQPNYLLITSLEFDHADIYGDVDSIIDAFASLLRTMSADKTVIFNADDSNIAKAIARSDTLAQLVSYGSRGDFIAHHAADDRCGWRFTASLNGQELGEISIPLYGDHNLSNALGCYALLYRYGLSHQQIAEGFSKFLGVKRRLEEKVVGDRTIIDDFAHHPTAVRETIKAAKQRYPDKKICAIFEPRSATSCTKVFEQSYFSALSKADRVMLAPLGRSLPSDMRLDTEAIAAQLRRASVDAEAFSSIDDLRRALLSMDKDFIWLFMSNGNFAGLLEELS